MWRKAHFTGLNCQEEITTILKTVYWNLGSTVRTKYGSSPKNVFQQVYDPTRPLHPPSSVNRVRADPYRRNSTGNRPCMLPAQWKIEEKYQSLKKGIQRINQGSERNRREIGSPKMTGIYYNTVAPYNLSGYISRLLYLM